MLRKNLLVVAYVGVLSAGQTGTARQSAAPGKEPERQSVDTLTGILMDAGCGAIANRSAWARPGGAAASADRSRSATSGAETPSRGGSFLTVREKYRDCMAKPTSRSFALHADGKLYVFDNAGNQIVAQQMGNEAFHAAMSDASGSPKWMSVTVQGSPSGDRLLVTSIRK